MTANNVPQFIFPTLSMDAAAVDNNNVDDYIMDNIGFGPSVPIEHDQVDEKDLDSEHGSLESEWIPLPSQRGSEKGDNGTGENNDEETNSLKSKRSSGSSSYDHIDEEDFSAGGVALLHLKDTTAANLMSILVDRLVKTSHQVSEARQYILSRREDLFESSEADFHDFAVVNDQLSMHSSNGMAHLQNQSAKLLQALELVREAARQQKNKFSSVSSKVVARHRGSIRTCTTKTLENITEVLNLFETRLGQKNDKSTRVEIEKTIVLLRKVCDRVNEALEFLQNIKRQVNSPIEAQPEPETSSDFWKEDSDLSPGIENETFLSDSDEGLPGRPGYVPKAPIHSSLKVELRDRAAGNVPLQAVVPDSVSEERRQMQGNLVSPSEPGESLEPEALIGPAEGLAFPHESQRNHPYEDELDDGTDSDRSSDDEPILSGSRYSFQARSRNTRRLFHTEEPDIDLEEENNVGRQALVLPGQVELPQDEIKPTNTLEDIPEEDGKQTDTHEGGQTQEEAPLSEGELNPEQTVLAPTSSNGGSPREARSETGAQTGNEIVQEETPVSTGQPHTLELTTSLGDIPEAAATAQEVAQPDTLQNEEEVQLDTEAIVRAFLLGDTPAPSHTTRGGESPTYPRMGSSARCPKIPKNCRWILAMACLAGLGLYYSSQPNALPNEQGSTNDPTGVGFWTRAPSRGRVNERIPAYCRKCNHESFQEALEQRERCGHRFAVCSPSFLGLIFRVDTDLGWWAVVTYMLRL
ncbi:uncharacterized protein BDZ99DRAFT_549468 [Mytilinidion resinicola]|uniref:Uncharacterized protein n=1 Tax=Mytilinidion resinicola TaxID=574789 RepID=A0A6A6Z2I6_9PEZI|nr:uncharacterized protein BDZ99DRAFT_549468 [Mytilinidion resinicola]KAF2815018.1 hypothetical protein BDZ99DRAFT_549468 [Mytilinidion resinicola]